MTGLFFALQFFVGLLVVRFREINQSYISRVRIHQDIGGFEVGQNVFEVVEQPNPVHHLAQDGNQFPQPPLQRVVFGELFQVHWHIFHFLVHVERCLVVGGCGEHTLVESAVDEEFTIRAPCGFAFDASFEFVEQPFVRCNVFEVSFGRHHFDHPMF